MPIKERGFHADFLAKKGGQLDGRITQYKLARRHFFEEFNQPVAAFKSAGAGAATGTTGDVNILRTGENIFEYHIKGTQTIVAPVATATGLNIGMDQTDNDGVELTPGIIAAVRRRACYLVGTDPSFYTRVKAKIATAAGTDDFCIGFRKAEAYQANVDDYDEAAWLGVGQGAAGRFNSETILNNGATTTTNLGLTAWANAGTHELEVRVIGRAVTMYVDNVQVGAPAFSFDSGEYLVPFIFLLQANAAQTGALDLIEWEGGPLDYRL